MEATESRSRVVLVVEYEGTRYCGFQYQAGVATVQDELEQAILKLTGECVRVIGASRTDSGVHARGQVVSFRTRAAYAPGVFVRGLNHYLPDDIAVREAYRVGAGFKVRGEAVSREYQYQILNAPVRSPLTRSHAHHVPQPLDAEAMDQAARDLCGRHDFASFVSFEMKRSTVRTVSHASVTREGEYVVFRMVANSFLPHQVRNIVGVLVQIGLGKLGKGHVRRLLDARKPGLAGPTAPPHGLSLMRVNYACPLGAM
ncbi:MAG: tRNA pseudouridine(38-40) synthase TruA [Chloroflexota bacterium]